MYKIRKVENEDMNKQSSNSKNLKNSTRGITLIALVITIIVLLILAAISIATLTGQNGLLTRANEAKTETEEAEDIEKIKLAVSEAQIGEIGYTKIGESNLQNAIDKQFGEDNAFVVDNGNGNFTISITNSGKNYDIINNTVKENNDIGNFYQTVKIGDYVIYKEKIWRVICIENNSICIALETTDYNIKPINNGFNENTEDNMINFANFLSEKRISEVDINITDLGSETLNFYDSKYTNYYQLSMSLKQIEKSLIQSGDKNVYYGYFEERNAITGNSTIWNKDDWKDTNGVIMTSPKGYWISTYYGCNTSNNYYNWVLYTDGRIGISAYNGGTNIRPVVAIKSSINIDITNSKGTQDNPWKIEE